MWDFKEQWGCVMHVLSHHTQAIADAVKYYKMLYNMWECTHSTQRTESTENFQKIVWNKQKNVHARKTHRIALFSHRIKMMHNNSFLRYSFKFERFCASHSVYSVFMHRKTDTSKTRKKSIVCEKMRKMNIWRLAHMLFVNSYLFEYSYKILALLWVFE